MHKVTAITLPQFCDRHQLLIVHFKCCYQLYIDNTDDAYLIEDVDFDSSYMYILLKCSQVDYTGAKRLYVLEDSNDGGFRLVFLLAFISVYSELNFRILLLIM